jgi:2-polyprenyl-3-methyl-5-hydroxy-6-metoxy-1,4-benzoquinol methylase
MIDQSSFWNRVYETKGEAEVSWFQTNPEPSIEFIRRYAPDRSASIIDIGGGLSRLADHLLADGFQNLSVLDIASEAIALAQDRIGNGKVSVKWIVSDVTKWQPNDHYDIWHDRAVFHFLTEFEDQMAYIVRLKHALKRSGFLVIGTFALDGPEKCSGLPVMRHDFHSLQNLFGEAFRLIETRKHDHQTPFQTIQHFQYSIFQHIA